MLNQLPTEQWLKLMVKWKELAALVEKLPSRQLPFGSGCTGSGLDAYAFQLFADVMHSMTGIRIPFQNELEVECNTKKRVWLKHFGKARFLSADVSDLINETGTNEATGNVEEYPQWFFLYVFGFSCKDLSTLNNHSGGYKSSCIESGAGSTGVTWKGNLAYVTRIQPWMLLIENVVAALKGRNREQIFKDLQEAGYIIAAVLLNSCEVGHPQYRPRAWFLALLATRAQDPNVQAQLEDMLALLKLQGVIPICEFLLPPDHPHFKNVFASRQVRGKQSRRFRWFLDHWKSRVREGDITRLKIPPELVSNIAEFNGLSAREADMLTIFHQKNALFRRPVVELKHSISRVELRETMAKQISSCLLPGSRLLLVDQRPIPRLLLGVEAMSIQGIPPEHTWPATIGSSPILTDSDWMDMAGNSFAGGCLVAMLIAGLSMIEIDANAD